MNDILIVHHKPNAQNLESWIAIIDNEIVGHIYMQLEPNKRLKFLDAYVDSNHRRKGIYRRLWETRWEYVNKTYSGWVIYAWCKEASLPLLLEKGFSSGEICTYVEKRIN